MPTWLFSETVIIEAEYKTTLKLQHHLLDTVLQSHTQSLLEGEDLLQVSTQDGAVCTAQPEYTRLA